MNLGSYRRGILYSLMIVLVGVAFIGSLEMLMLLTSPLILLEWLILLGVFTAVMLMMADRATRYWTSYPMIIVALSWVQLGFTATLWLVIGGGGLCVLIAMRRADTVALDEHLVQVVAVGMAILVAQGIALASGAVASFLLLSLALIAAYLTAQVIYIGLEAVDWRRHLTATLRFSPSEIPLLLIIPAFPLIRVEIGFVPYGLLLVLVVMQALRQKQLYAAQTTLEQRLHDMASVNTLGQAIASDVDMTSISNNLHRQVQRLMNTTSFFLVLYDEEEQVMRYPHLYHDGRLHMNVTRSPGRSITDYVIAHQESLLWHPFDDDFACRDQIDMDEVRDQVYACVPLVVSDKVIGALGVAHHDDPTALTTHDLELLETIANQTSLAIRNAMLYERTNSLADSLSKVNVSLQDVMFNLDKGDALETACDIAINISGADCSAIYLLQNNYDNQMARVKFVGDSEIAIPELLAYRPDTFDEGVRVVRRKDETNGEQTIHELASFHDCWQVPLRSGNTLIGVLALYHRQAARVESSELSLLMMLANHITAALDNADLLQALELYAAEQAQLVHLSRISSNDLDLERIVENVCDMLRQMMDMQQVRVGLYNHDDASLSFFTMDASFQRVMMTEIDPHQVPEFADLIRGDSFGTIRLYDADQEPISPALQAHMRDAGARTIALVPMRMNQRMIGLITLMDERQQVFNDNDYRLLEMATHQISAQVHNALIHRLTEEALVQRLEQLSLIEDIAQQISRSLDLDLVIDKVLEAALQATQSDVAVIVLSHPHQEMLEAIWLELIDERIIRHQRHMRPFGGVTERVLNTGEALIIPDNRQHAEYYQATDQVYLSSLLVPLRIGDKITGVLTLESKRLDFFTLEQAGFIKSLAGHAAISIDNANLLEERERQINTLTLLRQLSLETLTVVERERIAEAILETTLIILGGQASVLYAHDTNTHQLHPITSMILRDGHITTHEVDLSPALHAQIAEQARLSHQQGRITQALEMDESPLEDADAGSYLLIPIRRRGDLTEIMVVIYDAQYPLTEADDNTIKLLAVQVANQLDNAMLSEAIHNSNNRLRAILDSTREGIILLDTQNRVQDSNIAAERMLRIALRDHIPMPFKDLVKAHGHQDIWALANRYTEPPTQINGQEYAIHFDGENPLYVKTLVATVRDTSRDLVMGQLLILRDITEEKELEAFRERIQRMVVHDLRGPLSSIITSLYLSMSMIELPGEKPLKETLIPTLEVSLDSAQNLMSLVDTLRDLPKIPQMQIEQRQVPIAELVDSAYLSLSSNLTEAQIEVDYAFDAVRADLYVDEDLIRRVFTNLLNNAFKFTPENGTIRISADYEADKDGYIRLLVNDTGSGIPNDQRERIFEQFAQIKGRRPRAGGKGTGLGLYFCKLAVEAHDGRIWVEPDADLPGACFAFTLPCVPQDAHDTNADKHEPLPLLDE